MNRLWDVACGGCIHCLVGYNEEMYPVWDPTVDADLAVVSCMVVPLGQSIDGDGTRTTKEGGRVQRREEVVDALEIIR